VRGRIEGTLAAAGAIKNIADIGAMAYDSLLILALWFLTTGIVVVLNGSEAVRGAWFQSLLFLEVYLFHMHFWRRNGATLGMQAWHLRIQTPSGAPVTLMQGAIRCVVGSLSLLAFGLGYLWILIDPGRRSWNDYASKSHVVHVGKNVGGKPRPKGIKTGISRSHT